MSEADAADAEGFLADILLCLPVFGVTVFEKSKAPAHLPNGQQELFLRAKGIEARGIESAEGFIVRSRSQAVKTEVPSIHAYLSELRQSLLANGILQDAGEFYCLTEDYTFNSPSTAAGIFLGAPPMGAQSGRTQKGVR